MSPPPSFTKPEAPPSQPAILSTKRTSADDLQNWQKTIVTTLQDAQKGKKDFNEVIERICLDSPREFMIFTLKAFARMAIDQPKFMKIIRAALENPEIPEDYIEVFDVEVDVYEKEIRDGDQKQKLQDEIDRLVRHYKENKCEETDSEEENFHKRPFVDYNSFNIGVGVVIVLNAIVLGMEVNAEGGGFWLILEFVFCGLFIIEMVLRLYFHGLDTESCSLGQFFTSPRSNVWNCVDLLIVAITTIDLFILSAAGVGGTLKFVSMVRIVRVMRLIRLLRLFKIFKELWHVASTLLHSMVTLLWVSLLIFIFCYICAIFCTIVIGHNDTLYDPYFMDSNGWDHEVYFATVSRSLFSLFQVVTQDGWNEDIVRHVIYKQPAMLLFFILFVAISSLGLLNIIVGVVVENCLATAELDEAYLQKRKERDRQLVFSQLKEIFEDADADNSGTLTLEEVEIAINKPEVYNKLKMIEFPVEDPKQIFYLLDFDKCGELTIHEFITGCIRMNGSAKSKDLLVAQVALDTMKKHYDIFEVELSEFNNTVADLEWTARALITHGERVFLNPREYRMRHPEFHGEMPPVTAAMLDNAPWENKLKRHGGASGLGAIEDEVRSERVASEADLAEYTLAKSITREMPAKKNTGHGMRNGKANVNNGLASIEDADAPTKSRSDQLALPGAVAESALVPYGNG